MFCRQWSKAVDFNSGAVIRDPPLFFPFVNRAAETPCKTLSEGIRLLFSSFVLCSVGLLKLKIEAQTM